MAKYTASHYQTAFHEADTAFKTGNTQQAIDRLSSDHGIERGTAQAFVSCYARMMKGMVYKRGLSELATETFLKGIKAKHGREAFRRGIDSARLHLAYRESLGHHLPGLQTTVDRLAEQM
ncbi:MAG: hypothetical protein JNM65_09420 [Verrucomicrobiaceae bacterium]|nr:hypothetical protein [Verrucomicrobiaceae bacterium]